MEFRHFWYENIAHAWHLGHGFFWEIESIVSIIGLIIGLAWKLLRKRKAMKATGGEIEHVGEAHELPKDHWWRHWENYILWGGLGISILVFLFTVVFVAPFQRYKEEHERAEDTVKTIFETSNILQNTRADLHDSQNAFQKAQAALHESENARLKRLEDVKPEIGSNIISTVNALLAENDKRYAEYMSANQPELARLAALAATSPKPVTISNTAPMDLQTLRAEQPMVEKERMEMETQRKAEEALHKFNILQRNALAYGTFASTADSFVRLLTNQLAIVAAQVGDRVTSSYDAMPAEATSNMFRGIYATIKLETNSNWNFNITLHDWMKDFGEYKAEITQTSGSQSATIDYSLMSSFPQKPLHFELNGSRKFANVDERAGVISSMVRSIIRSQDNRFPLTNTAVLKQ